MSTSKLVLTEEDMNSIVVRRNGQYMVYGPDEFWPLCISSQLLPSDEIFAPDGNQFLRAD